MSKAIRSAVYTRKSSEEGLEQSFNSLEAQREACLAYIQSQKHEGWIPVAEPYDDGGFSGGNIERPALERLLQQIRCGTVQVVVVYKVDRLTRSLSDFAKIMEVFDRYQVSFVSVTQQFNTTTSMGRLTLNVLLSFAQFERELTGERIRDKVAASKKKGMWMGGVVPVGYECRNHQLLILPAEAEAVREIFRQYLRLASVGALQRYLAERGMYSKVRTSNAGRTTGGVVYSRGALYQLLSNRIYLGKIVHHGQVYPGQHEAIIDQELWNQVAAQLERNNQAHRIPGPRAQSSLLTGLLKDTNGVRFTPTHCVKKGKRYRYYTSQAAIRKQGDRPQICRYPARKLETMVASQIHRLLRTLDEYLKKGEQTPEKDRLLQRSKELAAQWPKMTLSKQEELVRALVKVVIVGQGSLWVDVDQGKLVVVLLGQKHTELTETTTIRLSADFRIVRRGAELEIHAPEDLGTRTPEPAMIKMVARAHQWYQQLVSGAITSIEELAEKTGLKRRYLRQSLQCATLSPAIVNAILTGRQTRQINRRKLLEAIPLDWQEQQQRFL